MVLGVGLGIYNLSWIVKGWNEFEESYPRYQLADAKIKIYLIEREERKKKIDSLVAEREKAKAQGNTALARECDVQIASIALSLICRRG